MGLRVGLYAVEKRKTPTDQPTVYAIPTEISWLHLHLMFNIMFALI
jgi:hypothetical protein